VVTGFAVEGMRLTLPSDETVAGLGPRVCTEAVAGLRWLACPTSAAALMLAQAIDAAVDTLTAASEHERCCTRPVPFSPMTTVRAQERQVEFVRCVPRLGRRGP
jgi:hypothetical protein